MKILLLADPHGLGDEGARNVSKQIQAHLSAEHEVLSIPARQAVKRINQIRRFEPEVIHALHGPSKRTFYLLALLHLVCSKATCFISLSQPDLNLFDNSSPFWRRFRFIRMFSQDIESERFFSRLGFPVYPVPNGVDLEHFNQVSPLLPQALMDKISADKKLLLHVGHIKKSRGLETLAELGKTPGWQAIMVSSTRYQADPEVRSMLEDAGCIVIQEFIEDLPGLYNRADAYLFPVTELDGSIDTPLTVLEALACNCPVLSTPFKALPRFLKEGEGIRYFRSAHEAQSYLSMITEDDKKSPRKQVSAMSWRHVTSQIVELYQTINNRQSTGC